MGDTVHDAVSLTSSDTFASADRDLIVQLAQISYDTEKNLAIAPPPVSVESHIAPTLLVGHIPTADDRSALVTMYLFETLQE